MKKVGYNRKRGNNKLQSKRNISTLQQMYLKLRGKIFPMVDCRCIFLKAVDLGLNIF